MWLPFLYSALMSDLLNKMYVSLWERNGNMVLVEGVVNDFLDASHQGIAFLDEHPNIDLEVNAT